MKYTPENLILDISGCNQFAEVDEMKLPECKADVDTQCLMTKFRQYLDDNTFVDSLKKQGVDAKTAEKNLATFLKKVTEKQGINGWPPEKNKAQYEKLEIQLTHLIKKFQDSNDTDNLRSLIFEYCIFGDFCSLKISEITHQFWRFSFGNLADYTESSQLHPLFQMIYSQAFNQTVFEINKMQGHSQEIHTYQCLRKLVRQMGYMLPYDPSLDDALQNPDNDLYSSTGIDDFPMSYIKDLFPTLLMGNLIQRFQNIQEELIREKKWSLIGDFLKTLKDAIEQNLTQGIGWISPGMKDLYCQKVQEKNLQIEAANAKVDTAQKVVEACKTHPDVASFERCKATLDELQKKLEYNLRECAERNPSKREQEIQAAKHAIEDQKSSSINFPLPGGQKRKADMMEGTCELLDQLTCEYEIYAKEVKQLKPEIEVCQYLIKQASESDAAKEYHSAIDKVKQLKASAEGVKQERTGIRDVVDRVLTDQKLCDMEADIPLLENNAWIFIMHMQGFLTQPFQITQP